MQPIVGARDGRSFFAELYTPAFSGVVRVDARTSRVTRIRRFPNAHDDQADGSFDGRWFVFSEYHSLEDPFDDFVTFAWDSHNGTLTQLGEAKLDPNGHPWPGAWRQPDVRAGFATWSQGAGPGGAGEVHAYDLAHGVDRVVRRGHPAGSFFVAGPTVVWPESLGRGELTHMLAANARTGAAVPAPPALARLRGIGGLFTDGRSVVYPSAKYTSLWRVPSLTGRPQLVFKPMRGHYVDNSVRVGGRYFLFSSEAHAYVADGRVRRYFDLGVRNDGLAVDGRALIVEHWAPGKRIHPKGTVMFVPVRSLPRLPRCAG
jgi:hypothetical protein